MATIVVVDDESLITDVLAYLLGEAGHIVHVARNGAEAFELIHRLVPDLIITDYMMPVMSGFELAQAVKANPVTACIPIILASAAQGASAREHADLFFEILDKPYSPPRLLQVIAGLFGENSGTVDCI
jgi:CheY-like chemotaxis protein